MTFGQPRANWRNGDHGSIGPQDTAPAAESRIEWEHRDCSIRARAHDVIAAWEQGGFVPPALYHALIELRDALTRAQPA